MQVAAAHPQVVSREELPAALVSKELEIQRDRVRAEGKPEKMLDKIAEGRMSKFYEEVCLLEQPFIRENTVSIAELIKAASGKIGDTSDDSAFCALQSGRYGRRARRGSESAASNRVRHRKGHGPFQTHSPQNQR